MSDSRTIAYAVPSSRPVQMRLLREVVVAFGLIVFGWAFLTRSHRLFAGPVPMVVGTNNGDAVRDLIERPASENVDLGPYTVSTFLGFHVVHWPSQAPGSPYVQVPAWAVVAFVVGSVGVTFRLTRQPPIPTAATEDSRP